MEKIGKIKTVSESHGEGKNGPWTRYLFEMEDGFKISTFDKKIGEEFKPGSTVQMDLKQDGQYQRLLSMKIIEEIRPDSKAAPQMFARDKSIIAQCLVKAWASSTHTVGDVLDAYKHFLENL